MNSGESTNTRIGPLEFAFPPFNNVPGANETDLYPQLALAQPSGPSTAHPYAPPHQPVALPAAETGNQAHFYREFTGVLPNSNPSAFPQVAQQASVEGAEESESEDLDIEGVKSIVYPYSSLYDIAGSSAIGFVLQNYATWVTSFFDPLKIVHKTKQIVLHQFSLSNASRSRVLLIAQLLNIVTKQRALDKQGAMVLGVLRDSTSQSIAECSLQYPISDEARQRASSALSNVLELMTVQVMAAPLIACPPPHPPHLFDVLLDPSLDLRHFAVADVILGVITGRATLCRYHIPWSLDISERLLERGENQGAEWLIGIPDQFIMVLAYMIGLRRDAQIQVSGSDVYGHDDILWHTRIGEGFRKDSREVIDSVTAQKLEDDIRKIRILPCESNDPALTIIRMVVQECWREVVHIYFYMALCGASAEDPRVQQAQKKYMRLFTGIKPGRNPDAFLATPMIVAGLATIKPKDRRALVSRTLRLPENSNPETMGNDLVRILENVWARAATEGRPAYWDDLSVGFQAVTGM
ncbi:hypothetical protein BN14_04025 [Rhizoctonia solani AG-1 IB]|uniref:Fungal-specific transcription factor domain protein n=1 Tax=Thanatephorus cucumeris (strain AG1-IB / isolate 7/3/14) TaxID=1108050 RepID=M5BS27_THACB|nr:hypothetical protein BN14_04025 [Rhizoctonia solani AG-1 IB]